MNSNGRIEIWARDYDLGSTDNCTEQEDLWFTFFGARPAYGFEDEDHYFRGDGILATPSEYEAEWPKSGCMLTEHQVLCLPVMTFQTE